ncbi:MAG: helix-turn-helix transcriptional regulator [Candidatus Omnitrophica bacterium]|nr:helix-turn-helix transcriptional regulator [Candidatus Omnitrophota bacterium]
MTDKLIRSRVRRLRFENGEMTQQELADQVGVTRQTIIAIEANRYSPSLTLAFKIARFFGVSIEDVFHYEDGDAGD